MSGLPKPVSDLISMFERLPGIGPKSAARIVFYLLNTPKEFVDGFTQSMLNIKSRIKVCSSCYGVSEKEVCDICLDTKRNKRVICVVERAIDVVALEKVGGFDGVYHVLGSAINPLEHVGPDDIRLFELIERLKRLLSDEEQIEVIVATNPTMEGQATALYIKKKVGEIDDKIVVTRIGSGLPIGADLEFADQATLSSAMEGRRAL